MEFVTDSREWLHITLSSIGDAVITTDANGTVTFLNPVAQALTGWTQEQAVGVSLQTVFHIVNEQTRAEVANPALRALNEGLIVGLANHTLLISKDGTERPIDDSAAPIRNDSGQTAGAVLVFRDITERRRVERAMALLAAIIESSDDAIVSKNLDGIITSWNRGAQRLFGYSAEEAIGMPVTMLIPRDHVDEEPEILQGIKRGKAVDHYETVRKRKDGSLVNISLTVSPLKDASGRIIGASKVARDITERKRLEEATRESEVRYRRLFETAKDGVLILDADSGKIIDANVFMTGLTGLEYSELVGRELYEIGFFQDIEENKRTFQELQRTGYMRHEHLPIQNQRGELVAVEFVANVYHEDHKLVAQCNVRDISERVRVERKIASQAEAIASESRRKDEFLAMLSHELRNHLAPIRTAAHLLKVHEPGSKNAVQQQARQVIERQVANLTKLVSDLLEVSRVVSGRIRLDQQVLDINEVIQHAVQTATPLIELGHHELVLNLCNDPAWVNADPTRMEEVFVNLIGNAAKFTPDGGRIEVSCESQRGQNHVQIRVRDNGVGIDAKLLPRIFNLFTQADRSLDRAAGGLGIGLALADRLVNLHGGTIEAHSPPHGETRGSEFVVRFPLASAPELPPAPAPDEIGSTPDALRVLVVDDNIDPAMMLATALRHMGHSVQSAYNGPDGLKVALQWRPDIVLLDIGLPGLDGYEVARRLRADSTLCCAGKNMKLIALTGYGRDTDVALAGEAGFDAHLIKPVELDQLQKQLVTSKVAD